MGKTALITGIAGQDGQYLSEFLLGCGEYERVVGMIHSQRPEPENRLRELFPKLEFAKGDLADQASLNAVVRETAPTEVYNLGGFSHVGDSFKSPEKYYNVTGTGVLRILNAIKDHAPYARFYQASSSEMFGKVQETPQTERTPFYPRSPYGVAKLAGHWTTVNYREFANLFACSGILFNHESPRRGSEFLTRKVTIAAARISLGLQDHVELGNLDSKRDWGFAGDFVQAMHAMLQQNEPDDYVVATGQAHTGEEFVERAFAAVGLPITWDTEPPTGDGDLRTKELRRIGVTKEGKIVVRISEKFYRPAEVDLLIGDSTKAKRKLGWEPTISFTELVTMMAENDVREIKEKAKG